MIEKRMDSIAHNNQKIVTDMESTSNSDKTIAYNEMCRRIVQANPSTPNKMKRFDKFKANFHFYIRQFTRNPLLVKTFNFCSNCWVSKWNYLLQLWSRSSSQSYFVGEYFKYRNFCFLP
uniref:Uncharacterized protein n=1 Tax=Meloidogyne enterolobii TaxID=390850 RepID=A0A6V7XGH7_MELEN|nr:unnamed protein product [Meloidogyne enterolobii]